MSLACGDCAGSAVSAETSPGTVTHTSPAKAIQIKTQKAIFVIGTGRSGTHWIGYIIAAHPEIRASIEENPMFGLVTTMAMNPQKEKELLPKLIQVYKTQLIKSAPLHYLDKSHPNIWLAEQLKRALPNALFVGIERNPFSTISSMLKHKGVSDWHRRWKEFPIPNRFLGISAELASKYDQLPLASKCALRWVSHHNQMDSLRKSLGDSLLVINYESLIRHTKEEIGKLQIFLNLNTSFSSMEVKEESLNKWNNQLSKDQVEQISNIVGFTPSQINTRRFQG